MKDEIKIRVWVDSWGENKKGFLELTQGWRWGVVGHLLLPLMKDEIKIRV
jgi:hypothetical protein